MIGPDLSGCTILLVDDEEANLDLLESILHMEGYRSLARTPDARQAISLVEACAPDLVLLDLHMPHRSGFQVLAELRARLGPAEYLPVLVLTADATREARERALAGGARDFLTKPFDAVEVLLRVRNLLETRVLHRRQHEARLEAEAASRRAALLAEASRVLGTSLDTATTLSQLARLLAPGLADACSVLRLEGGRYVPVASAPHAFALDVACVDGEAVAEYALRICSAIDSGGASVIPLGTADDEGVAIVAPMRVQGRGVGALVLERRGAGTRFEPRDVELAEELASRSALALENARLFADAQLASAARDRMLSVVAHDLKNPLAVVAMYAEMLQSMQPPEADAYQREALESMRQSSSRMQQLIDDLLEFGRAERGALALQLAEVSVVELFAEARRLLRPLAAARSVVLRFDERAPAAVARLDAGRILQVLSNLVGNALRFTPPGGSVDVSCQTDGDALHVAVADTGPGIAAADLPHIFGAFWQARDADRRGVGLGLWIARAIVEAHGGRIWVDSQEGAGATFQFTLPFAPAGGAVAPAPGQMTQATDVAVA